MPERPTVHLTGHRSQNIRPGIRPTGIRGHTEAELERKISTFGDEDFMAVLVKNAALEVGGPLSWDLPAEDNNPDALLHIQVENMCFCAPDVLEAVDLRIEIRATLIDDASGDLLWRDCLDWTIPAVYESLQQLTQADPSQREEMFSDLAVRVLRRLAKHLATQVQGG